MTQQSKRGEETTRHDTDDTVESSLLREPLLVDSNLSAVGQLISTHRDWRIDTANPEKSVVFLSGPRSGGQLSPVSGNSDRGAQYLAAFYALSSEIEKWRRRHAEAQRAEDRPFSEPSSFAVIAQAVRCRVQRVQDTRFHVRVPSTLLPMSSLGMPSSLKNLLLSPELNSGGLVLVTGSYGCGKTNTITAVVRERHDFKPGAAVRLKPMLTFLFDPASGARLA